MHLVSSHSPFPSGWGVVHMHDYDLVTISRTKSASEKNK